MHVSIKSVITLRFIRIVLDHKGADNKAFAIAGCNDTDATSATTYSVTPGFKRSQHPSECLNFWYNIKVSPQYNCNRLDNIYKALLNLFCTFEVNCNLI